MKKSVLFLSLVSLVGLTGCKVKTSTATNTTPTTTVTPEEKTGTVTLSFDPTQGSVSSNKTVGKVGDTITLTVTPNDGYVVKEVKANNVALTGPTYSFTLVEGNNTVNVEFEATYGISISGEASMLIGRSQTLNAIVKVANEVDSTASVTWSSDKEDVLSVNSSTGEVTALAAGTAVVTATLASDSDKKATLSITVAEPTFDKTNFNIKDNYTFDTEVGDDNNHKSHVIINDKMSYIAATGGWFEDGKDKEAVQWFADGKVYPVEIVSDTECNYYANEYLTDSDDQPMASSTYISGFDGTVAFTNTDFKFVTYLGGNDFFVTSPKSEESLDAFTSFVLSKSFVKADAVLSKYSALNETPVSFITSITEEDQSISLVGEIVGLKADGTIDDSEVALEYKFSNFGNSTLANFPEPTLKYFHTGSEAGEGDGDGEDFDGGESESGEGEESGTTDSTGDGE